MENKGMSEPKVEHRQYLIYYPPGSSFVEADDDIVDNKILAEQLLRELVKGASVGFPQDAGDGAKWELYQKIDGKFVRVQTPTKEYPDFKTDFKTAEVECGNCGWKYRYDPYRHLLNAVQCQDCGNMICIPGRE